MQPAGRLRLTVSIVALGLALSACSTTYQLGNMVGKGKGAERGEATSSITPTATAGGEDFAAGADLTFAKAAAAELMARGSKDASLPWENPRTGARGTVTPLATSYEHDGAPCRDFLVSYFQGERQAWFQGGACRSGSKWVVREVKPLHRT